MILLWGVMNIPLWLTVAVPFLVILYIYLSWNFKAVKQMGLTGPKPLPGTGNLYKMWRKAAHIVDAEEHRKYGKLYGVFEGREAALRISDDKIATEILIKETEKYVPHRGLLGGHCYLQRSYNETTGEQSNLLNETLTTNNMQLLWPAIQTVCRRMVHRLRNGLSNHKVADLRLFTSRLMAEAIALCVFGISPESGEGETLVAILEKLSSPKVSVATPLLVSFPAILKKLFFSVPYSSKSLPLLKRFAKDAVENSLKKPKSTLEKQTLLEILLESQLVKYEKTNTNSKTTIDDTNEKEQSQEEQSQEEQSKVEQSKVELSKVEQSKVEQSKVEQSKERKLTNEQMNAFTELIVELVLNAQEVTSAALVQTLYQLATNSNWQEQLAREIRSENDTREYKITPDTLSRMPMLNAILMETMRLAPPVTRLQRQAKEACKLGAIDIPKGTALSISLFTMQHDRDLYIDANTFDPTRFRGKAWFKREELSFCPFGAGKFDCPGKHLALLLLQFGLFSLVDNFRFEACGLTKIPFEGALLHTVLSPRYGVWLKVGN